MLNAEGIQALLDEGAELEIHHGGKTSYYKNLLKATSIGVPFSFPTACFVDDLCNPTTFMAPTLPHSADSALTAGRLVLGLIGFTILVFRVSHASRTIDRCRVAASVSSCVAVGDTSGQTQYARHERHRVVHVYPEAHAKSVHTLLPRASTPCGPCRRLRMRRRGQRSRILTTAEFCQRCIQEVSCQTTA